MPVPSNLPVPPGPLRPSTSQAAPPLALAAASPAAVANFEALGDNDTAIPPDTQGAAGPNHLMVTLNTQVRIQDKSGTVLSTVTLDSFWTSTGGTGIFDPRVLYDPFANRWIFTAATDGENANSSIVLGVSQTSDPTGSWNLYRRPADSSGVNWGDYPQVGFNKDWIVVTVNMFSISAGTFQGAKVFLFRKSPLYAGSQAIVTEFLDNPNNGGAPTPASTYDNSLSTLYLIRDWNGNTGSGGVIRISSISGPLGSEVYTPSGPFVQTANTWAQEPPNGNDFLPQMGIPQLIQADDSRILNVVYRNGSLWATQNAFLPAGAPSRTAAQWWQFATDGTLQQFGRVDDPSGSVFYAYPSIAVNKQNDVLLGYSTFSANQFASANYSFRSGGDPVNTLRSSTVLKTGQASYYKTFGGPQNRWGDYSNTVIDPVNDLDFWTIQEFAASPKFNNGDDRWDTWWGKVSPPKKRGGQITSQ